jgi:ribonucleases P/MRP protein subunit RPP40
VECHKVLYYGPLLFLIFINEIDKNIVSKILKFADDTKIVAIVGSDEEDERLQKDLNTMYKWSEDLTDAL